MIRDMVRIVTYTFAMTCLCCVPMLMAGAWVLVSYVYLNVSIDMMPPHALSHTDHPAFIHTYNTLSHGPVFEL